MNTLFEQDLKVGDKVDYNGLGKVRKGEIIKRTKSTIIIQLMFSTVKLKFVPNLPAYNIGISLTKDETSY